MNTIPAAGATVEIIARNPLKAGAVCDQLRAGNPDASVAFTIADTADLDGLGLAAAALRARHPHIDVCAQRRSARSETFVRAQRHRADDRESGRRSVPC